MTLDAIKNAAKSYGCRKYVGVKTAHFFAFRSLKETNEFARWAVNHDLHIVRSITHLWVSVRFKET